MKKLFKFYVLIHLVLYVTIVRINVNKTCYQQLVPFSKQKNEVLEKKFHFYYNATHTKNGK